MKVSFDFPKATVTSRHETVTIEINGDETVSIRKSDEGSIVSIGSVEIPAWDTDETRIAMSILEIIVKGVASAIPLSDDDNVVMMEECDTYFLTTDGGVGILKNSSYCNLGFTHVVNGKVEYSCGSYGGIARPGTTVRQYNYAMGSGMRSYVAKKISHEEALAILSK